MTISRFYRILLALCGLVGVSIQIHDDGWGMLLYYTVLSNILVFSSLIFFIIYDFKKGDATTNTKLLRYKGGVTMAILITGVIYHILWLLLQNLRNSGPSAISWFTILSLGDWCLIPSFSMRRKPTVSVNQFTGQWSLCLTLPLPF